MIQKLKKLSLCRVSINNCCVGSLITPKYSCVCVMQLSYMPCCIPTLTVLYMIISVPDENNKQVMVPVSLELKNYSECGEWKSAIDQSVILARINDKTGGYNEYTVAVLLLFLVQYAVKAEA